MGDGVSQNVWEKLDSERTENQRLRARIARLEAALREIDALPDVEADHRGVIARDALSTGS